MVLDAGTGNISFAEAVGNTTKLGNLTANSTGTTQIGSTVNATSLTTNPGGTTQINANVTTTGNQTYGDAVNVTSNAALDAGTSTATFASTLAANTNNLTITADEIDFNGNVSSTGNLTLQPKTPSQNIALGGNVATSSLDLTNNELSRLQNGFSSITIGRDNGSGTIAVDNPVTFTDPVTFRSPAGAINVNASINGTDNASVTFNGTTNLNTPNAVTSSNNDVTFNSPVFLDADSTITGKNITFNSTVQSASGSPSTPRALTVNSNSNGVTAFKGEVGGNNQPLASLTTNADGKTEIGANITTNGNTLTFNDAVVLTNDVVLTDTGSTGITFNGTVNTYGRSLAAIADNGNITFSNIDTDGGNVDLKAKGISYSNSGLIDTSNYSNAGNVTLTSTQGDIQIGAIDARSSSGRGGNITINSTNFFRAQSTIPNTNTSISAVGQTEGGRITINHVGGFLNNPKQEFVIGDASINGTAGDIVTGKAGQEVVLRAGESFPSSITRGSQEILSINTDDPKPPPPPPPPPPQVKVPEEVKKDGESLTRSPQGITITETPPITSDPTMQAEMMQCQEFEQYFGKNLKQFFSANNSCNEVATVEDIQNVLRSIKAQTGNRSALVYILPEEQALKIVAYFPDGAPVTQIVPQANREALLKVAKTFRNEVAPFETDVITSEIKLNVSKLKTKNYSTAAQQLYKWLIDPIATQLKAHKIDTLVLSAGSGLRSLPFAALHDGKQFLVEKYSIGIIPSLNLTDTRYRPLKNSQILAMGASVFERLNPLPAVPVEVGAIVQAPWKGRSFLNQDFTLDKLKSQRQGQTYNIVHLATHGKFQPGDPSSSYIQMWNQRLGLDQLRQLQLDLPTVELLTLSVCETALGDENAELGFAGLAVAAGVKTSMASLWEVSDVVTLSLMTEFYRQLNRTTIKAEALRQVQIAMLKGKVHR